LKVENIAKRVESLDQKVATQEVLNQLFDRILSALDERVPASLPMFKAFDCILEASAGLQVRKNLIAILGKIKSQKVVELLEDAKKNGESLGSFSAILKVLKGKKLMSEKRLIEISDDWQ
jgi:acetyl-CoA carboxylase carboxyltransferase component